MNSLRLGRLPGPAAWQHVASLALWPPGPGLARCFQVSAGPGPPGAALARATVTVAASHVRGHRRGGPARLGQLVPVAGLQVARIECPNLRSCLLGDVHPPLPQPQAATARRSRLLPRSPDPAAASASERGPSEGQSRRLAPRRGPGGGSDESRGARPADWSGRGGASSRSDDGANRRERARLPTRSRGRPRPFRTAVPAVRISACAAPRAAPQARHHADRHGGPGGRLGMRWSPGLRLLRRRHAPAACRARLAESDVSVDPTSTCGDASVKDIDVSERCPRRPPHL